MAVPLIQRSDFNHSLVHLTRERRVFPPGADKPELVASAFQVLKEILTSATIHGSGNEGFVKGHRRAVCLSEIPLASLHQFAEPPTAEKAKYRLYGIVLSKSAVFHAGGRPVIYLPDAEGDWIPADEKWRHVRFEAGQVDFTHEREWRVPGDLDLEKFGRFYVIVWSPKEARELMKLATPLGERIQSILPMHDIGMML
jgi:hypothetical protein